MSEPDPKDDGPAPSGGRLPKWWLRGAGLGLIGAAVVMHFATAGAQLALVAWGMGLLGLALATFGGLAPEPIEGDLEPAPEPTARVDAGRRPRISLAAIGLLTFGYGLLRIVHLAWEGGRASDEWWPVVIGAAAMVVAAVWGAVASAAPTPVRVAAPSENVRRGLITLVVLAALVLQVVVPMRYYLGDDRFDERFAWRMFSAVRVYRCDLSAVDMEDGRVTPVDLAHTIHVAWVNTMQRGREGVIQRYLGWRCETAEVDAARVTNRCVTPEGQRVPDLIREIDCSTGQLQSVEIE